MAYTHKENSGSLFKNEKREKDTHPHMTGTALIGGVEYWVSAWTKEGEKGRWQSLAFKPKEQPQEPPKGGSSKVGGADIADDLPFRQERDRY
jgi:hypothetical protein